MIEIRDTDAQGVLAVELSTLLDFLAAEGPLLTWAILDLYATGDLGDDRSMLDLERQVAESPTGLLLSWDELGVLASAFTQVIDGVFVGCRNAASIPPLHPKAELYARCEIVLEAVDSTLWAVYARDDRVLQRLQAAFHDVQAVPVPASVPV
jgi:hypothetical protein